MTRELGIVSTLLTLLGGCLGTGCTQSFKDAPLDQQIAAFKDTTQHLANLAQQTDAAYSAELVYDGQNAEAYVKQSAGLNVPIRVKLDIHGNAKKEEAKPAPNDSSPRVDVEDAETDAAEGGAAS